jgi:hypothetical protein
VLGWYRTLIAEKYDSTGPKQKKRGRPHIPQDVEEFILRLAKDNRNWGYKRIQETVIYHYCPVKVLGYG